jgi:cyclic beta-1,2-glucan synthetase
MVEPFVMAADVYSNDEHIGRGGWTWYTGSSAWTYKVIEDEFVYKNQVKKIE